MLKYVPAILMFAILILFALVTAPVLIVVAIIALGALEITGLYRHMILWVPMMLWSTSFEHKGVVVLNWVWPSALVPPIFVDHSVYWRPGLFAIFALILIGAVIGWLLKRIFPQPVLQPFEFE